MLSFRTFECCFQVLGIFKAIWVISNFFKIYIFINFPIPGWRLLVNNFMIIIYLFFLLIYLKAKFFFSLLQSINTFSNSSNCVDFIRYSFCNDWPLLCRSQNCNCLWLVSSWWWVTIFVNKSKNKEEEKKNTKVQ